MLVVLNDDGDEDDVAIRICLGYENTAAHFIAHNVVMKWRQTY